MIALRALRAAALLFIAVLCVGWPTTALAQDAAKAECASAYEKSQELRASGSLRAARERLVVCAQNTCPAFVQSDCAQWLTEVQRELPTIVVVAKDKSGDDTVAVTVFMDDERLLTQLDGKAVAIDPGVHKFRFELEGADPIQQQIVIRQGQKDRVVPVSFAPAGNDLPQASPYNTAAPKDQSSATAGKPGPLRLYSYIAGGVGAAGLIGFTAFGLVGKAEESDLKKQPCAATSTCSASDVDSIKTKYILADVSLGIGIAGLGAGVALFILSQPKKAAPPPDSAGSVRLDVRTGPGIAYAGVRGAF